MHQGNGVRDRALLVVIRDKTDSRGSTDRLDELRRLAASAGVAVAQAVARECRQYDPAFFITAGKLAELKALVQEHDAGVVIFDNELSPAQQRNLEDELGIAVADRTGLILDIFAQRARSREGKLQVELAQLNYLQPRLRGRGQALSRLGGGIGTRGPGETKLEVDRRKVRQRIQRLQHSLEQVTHTRKIQRASRSRYGWYGAALVGYTNTGKSTLLNRLAGASVPAANRLFSTLDPTTRSVRLGGGSELLLSDTVGFIDKLPRQLIAAFKATLEELREAALLIHVIDASDPMVEERIAAVQSILDQIGVGEKETLYVFNKIDALGDRGMLKYWGRKFEPAVAVSARTGEDMEHLFGYLHQWIEHKTPRVRLRVPCSEHRTLARIIKSGKIFSRVPAGDAVLIEVRIDYRLAHALRRFAVFSTEY